MVTGLLECEKKFFQEHLEERSEGFGDFENGHEGDLLIFPLEM